MKKKYSVEETIVQTALTLFNESGIEYVGMRELALAMDMRIGNLTYYFPTKDALVNRLSMALSEENSKAIISVSDITMQHFFDIMEQVFRNHAKYRCLMLSFVHIMERNPLVAKRYSKVQNERTDTWKRNVGALKASNYISANADEVEFLVSSISLIARFWISEAAISNKRMNENEQIEHYLKMVARIFLPYATTKGKKELAKYL
jgi:AcrR family transcriptional regulator